MRGTHQKISIYAALVVGLWVSGMGATSPKAEWSTTTLEQLIVDASRILLGVISDVRDDIVVKTTARGEVRLTTLHALFSMPESFIPSTSDSVVQYSPTALGMEKNQTLLLFIASTGFGLDRVVGKRAGYFEVLPDPKMPGHRVVISLAKNKGLWGKELWSNTLTRSAMEAQLTGLSENKRLAIMKLASEECRSEPIPLELVKAAIRVLRPDAVQRTARP